MGGGGVAFQGEGEGARYVFKGQDMLHCIKPIVAFNFLGVYERTQELVMYI